MKNILSPKPQALNPKPQAFNPKPQIIIGPDTQALDPSYIAQALKSCIRLMDKTLHYFKYPKLWELWYIP